MHRARIQLDRDFCACTEAEMAAKGLNECGESEAVRGRHVAHYVALAEQAEQHARGPEQDAWVDRLRPSPWSTTNRHPPSADAP
jgi:predicted ATPase